MIDLYDPTETLTVADYQTQAKSLIQDFHNLQQTPLLVGGTGLYLQAITHGLTIPPVPPQTQLREQLSQIGQAEIYQWLQQVDPQASQRIHPNDQVRTLRALEVFYVLGKPLSNLQNQQPPDYPMLCIGLDIPDLSTYTQRIRVRTEQMLDQGWLTEIERLAEKYGWDLPLLQTLGYREMGQYLQGEINIDQAIADTTLHTRQFGKRQRTWFRNRMQLEWFNGDSQRVVEQIFGRIQAFRGLG